MRPSFRRVIVLLASMMLGGSLAAQQPQPPQPQQPPAAPPAGAPAAPQGPPAGGPPGRGGGRGRGGIQIQEGEECPPGTTEVRPRNCQAPSLPPEHPRLSPEVDARHAGHMVKKAKFPAIDFHGHPGGLLSTPEGLASLLASLDSLNVRMMVSADNMSGERLKTALASIQASPEKDRVRVLAGIDFRNVGPGWAEKAVAQLEADVAAGAVGVGEIAQGLRPVDHRSPTARASSSTIPSSIRSGRRAPGSTSRCSSTPPIRRSSSSRSTTPTSAGSSWRCSPSAAIRRIGSRASRTLMTERDNLFRSIRRRRSSPRTWAGTPTTSRASARCSTRCRTSYTEVGAVLYDIGRQPRAAHDFFVKYQDRILFGKDSFQPEEYPYYWRVFETSGRLLRLLPRLPRVLEAVRHRPAGRGAEEGLLPERAQAHAGAAADGLAEVGRKRAGSSPALFRIPLPASGFQLITSWLPASSPRLRLAAHWLLRSHLDRSNTPEPSGKLEAELEASAQFFVIVSPVTVASVLWAKRMP